MAGRRLLTLLAAVVLLAACEIARTEDSAAHGRATTAAGASIVRLPTPADSELPAGPLGVSIRRGRALLVATPDSLPHNVGGHLRWLGLTDPMWEKYKLGEAIKETDEKTDAFAIRNIYQKADAGEATMSIKGIADWPADTSMEALQKKGTVFIMCNNALNFWAMNVAKATNQPMEAVRAEFLAHIVPGVVIVPAMVMAVDQAQGRGCSYMRMG